MSTELRVALVGCGLISDSHIRAYEHYKGRARITVCCDIDPDKAQKSAERVGIGTCAVTKYEEILANEEVDAVEICTPHHIHTGSVIAAAHAGKHILCQKPLAKTLAECDAMITAAAEAGVVLYYGEFNRTLPSAVEAKRVIAEGGIGRLVGIQATFAYWQGGEYLTTAWRYDPNITGGGQLLDSGIHAIDLMLHIGGPVQSISCMTTRFRPELGGEDTAAVNVRFKEGHLGTLFSTQAAGIWYPDSVFAAFGTQGILTLGGMRGALTLHQPDLPNRHEVLLEAKGDPFIAMIGSYLDVIQKGIPNPSSGQVGRENLEFVLAAYKSVQTGQEIYLDEKTI